MAETIVPAGDATAVVVYSHRVFAQAIRSTTAAKLMAVGMSPRDQMNFVQMFDETSKGPGDTIKYDLIPNPQGAGVAGDGVIAGQEVPFTWYQDTLTINQLRQAELLVGRMSQQRVPYSMRDAAKVGLANWWKETFDYGLLNQLAGNTGVASFWGTNMTGMNSVTAPSNDHWYIQNRGVANGSTITEAALTNADTASIEAIPTLVAMAQSTLTNPIKPVVIKGIEVAGILFLHPLQVRDLKKNFTAGEWGDIYKAALQGGQITGNPLFTGAIGMFDNVVIHQDAHVPWGDNTQNLVTLADATTQPAPNARGAAGATTTSIARGVFVGAQAAALAFGGEEGPDGRPLRVRWVEELLDAANQLRVTAGMIFGIKRTRFNSSDYATIAYSSYAAA